MPEPQSTAFFVLMMVIFGALMCWLVLAKHLVFRVLAACLAFIPAVLFGIAAVNKYYDYYQNWSAAIADFSNSGVQTAAVPGTHLSAAGGVTRVLGNSVYVRLAAQQGFTFRLWLSGPASHLARNVYVYLPPQYFQTSYRGYRFPVVELVHGFPGQPQDWITVLGVTTTLSNLMSRGLAKPVVLVMPDANGARGVSLQCLNQVNGPQDATYLARDVPYYISRVLRVRPPGRSWGIAGYSEGGYCAANLGLQYSHTYGFAGVLSGYFKPLRNQLSHPSRLVSPFGGNKQLLKRNTPTTELLSLPLGTPVPQFWIGAGSGRGSAADVRDAQIFRQVVQLRQPTVVLRLLPGGGHTMFTWRLLVPPMLQWMTPKLAANAAQAEAQAKKHAHHKGKKKSAHHRARGQPVPSATPLRLSPSPKPPHHS